LNETTISLGDLLSNWSLTLSSGNSLGTLSDFRVDLLVESLKVGNLSLGEGSFPTGELLLESVLVFLLEEIHVGLDMSTEDVVSVLLGVVGPADLAFLGNDLAALASDGLLLLEVVAGEALGVVGNVDAAVNSALEGTEDTVAGGGPDQADIEEGLEGASVLVDALLVDVEELAVGSLDTLVEVGHTEVGEESSGDQETGGVAGSVVGETSLETESLELLGVGLSEHSIALDGGVDDLDDDAGVGPADAQSVLLGLVLVLVLLDESLSGLDCQSLPRVCVCT